MKASRLVLIALMLAAVWAVAQSDPWASLRVFEGKWEGPTSGKPGTGLTTREYRFELNHHFLWQGDDSVYEAPNQPRKQVIHKDLGFFSYDSETKKILWRQFHSEGLVNEYVLASQSRDGKSLVFVTTHIENLPGFRAKKLYRIISSDEIEETFLLAPAGKDFDVYTVAHLKRTK